MAIRNPDRKVLVLWMITLAMITFREARDGKMPRPNAYVPSSMVYALAAVLAEVAGDVAVLIAGGWTVNIALQLVSAPRTDTEGGGGGRGDASNNGRGDREAVPEPAARPGRGAGGRRRRAPTPRRRQALRSRMIRR